MIAGEHGKLQMKAPISPPRDAPVLKLDNPITAGLPPPQVSLPFCCLIVPNANC